MRSAAARRRQICKEIFGFSVFWTSRYPFRGWHKTFLQDGWECPAFDGWKAVSPVLTRAQGGCVVRLAEALCRSTVEIRAHVAAECGLNLLPFWLHQTSGPTGFWKYRKPSPCHAVHQRKNQALSSHFTKPPDCVELREQMKPSTSPMRLHPEYQAPKPRLAG